MNQHFHTSYCLFIFRHPVIPEDVSQQESDGEDDEQPTTSQAAIEEDIVARVNKMKDVVGKRALENIKKAQKRQKRNYDSRLVQPSVGESNH